MTLFRSIPAMLIMLAAVAILIATLVAPALLRQAPPATPLGAGAAQPAQVDAAKAVSVPVAAPAAAPKPSGVHFHFYQFDSGSNQKSTSGYGDTSCPGTNPCDDK